MVKVNNFAPIGPGAGSGGGSGGGGGTGTPTGGDLGGTLPAPTVTGIQGRPICVTAPTSGQAYVWDGSQWCPDDVGSGPQDYPHDARIEAIEVPFANTGFSTPALLVNQQWWTGNSAQNDFLTWRRLLAAGTWSIAFEHYVRTSRGISTFAISLDDSSWTDLGTIDSYAASPSSGNGTDTRTVLASLTIPSDALWYLRVKTATKNGSSAAYGIVFICMTLTRTGA